MSPALSSTDQVDVSTMQEVDKMAADSEPQGSGEKWRDEA